MNSIAFFKILALIFLPFLSIRLEKSFKLLNLTGSVINCFLLGISLGHLPLFRDTASVSINLSEITILLGLPLLLLSTDFKAWLKLAKPTLISFFVLIVVVCGVSFLMGSMMGKFSDELWIVSGMLAGVYIGGTPNLMAIGKALEIKPETLLLVNAAELMVGGIYFFIAVGILPRLSAYFLPAFTEPEEMCESDHVYQKIRDHWLSFKVQKKFQFRGLHILISSLVIGASVGISQILWQRMDPITILLCLSSFSLLLSTKKEIREFPGSGDSGHYLLLIFCCCIGSMANLSQLQADTFFYFLFCWMILIPSVVLHLLICYFLKIDRDTALVTSMAGIFGPAFIPALSDRLNNRWILVSGITTGLVGLALGNFLGLLISYLLKP